MLYEAAVEVADAENLLRLDAADERLLRRCLITGGIRIEQCGDFKTLSVENHRVIDDLPRVPRREDRHFAVKGVLTSVTCSLVGTLQVPVISDALNSKVSVLSKERLA